MKIVRSTIVVRPRRFAVPTSVIVLIASILLSGLSAQSQQNELPNLANRQTAAPGDSPDSAGPIATDLSPNITRPEIAKAMQRVANWQLQRLPAEAQYD